MARSENILIRLERGEKEAFQQAAQLSGLTLSAWVRERLRRAARIDLENAGKQIPFLKHQMEDI
jgi:hypothetical protein